MTSGERPNSVFHQRTKIDGTAPHAVTPQIEAGNVYLPEVTSARWMGGFIEECAAFPNGTYDL